MVAAGGVAAGVPGAHHRVHAAHEPGTRTTGWRPVFLDCLHPGFTNPTAFSPTGVLPLTHRGKYAMLVHRRSRSRFWPDRRRSRECLHLSQPTWTFRSANGAA